MPENAEKKSGWNWKDAVDLLKDGIELAEKVVGGRNALIAGTAGLALGVGLGVMVSIPSDKECAEYVAKQQADRSREALEKFLRAPVRGGF